MGRRKYLALTALATVGVAGCSGGGDETGTETPAPGSPSAVTLDFYSTLYGENNMAAANEMYHPESPAPELRPENFERFGGLENMGTEVESTEVISQGDGRARVHAEVLYTTAEETMDNTLTDYMFLRQQGEEWLVFRWVPERIRRIQATGAVEQFYATLYGENNIEGANTMYHPESDAAAVTAEQFDQYGGLENVEAEIQSSMVVDEGGGEAEVHVDVQYTTPDETSTATDHVFLRTQEGEWRIDEWRPEARDDDSTEG